MISNGIGVGLSGLVIAQLKDTSNDIKLTLDEESWFGNNIYNNFYKAILFYPINVYSLFILMIISFDFQLVYISLAHFLEVWVEDYKLDISDLGARCKQLILSFYAGS